MTLVSAYGDVRVIVIQDILCERGFMGVVVENRAIRRDSIPTNEHNDGLGRYVALSADALSEPGNYRIYVTSLDATTVQIENGRRLAVEATTTFDSQGFRIGSPPPPPVAVIIIVVVVVLVLIGAIIFIRLRVGMRTK
jgi:hypothetical protein